MAKFTLPDGLEGEVLWESQDAWKSAIDYKIVLVASAPVVFVFNPHNKVHRWRFADIKDTRTAFEKVGREYIAALSKANGEAE